MSGFAWRRWVQIGISVVVIVMVVASRQQLTWDRLGIVGLLLLNVAFNAFLLFRRSLRTPPE
jgi:hypothetical protein